MKKSIILLLLVMVTFIYCTLDFPKDPKAPKWDVQIEQIPLLKADTLRLGDQLKTKDFKRSGADSVLSLSVSSTSNFDLRDKLNIPPQNGFFSDQIGEYKVAVSQSAATEIQFTDLYPELSGFVGGDHIIPATTLAPTEDTVTLEDFEYISVVSGGMELKVQNRLGFVLDGDGKLDLIDVGFGNVLIESVELDRIEHGATGTYFVDLAGKKISSTIKTILYGSIVGSEGQTVNIPNDSGIDIVISPKTIIVDEAKAKIPEQTFDLSGSVDISTDSIKIRKTQIESGFIDITIKNHIDLNVKVNLKLPNVKDSNDQEEEINISIDRFSSQDVQIFFDNKSLDLESEELEFDLKMTIFPEQGEKITLHSTDSLAINLAVSEIKIKSITGDLNLAADFPNIQEELFNDLPDELENLNFHDVIFTLVFKNSPFDVDLNLIIEAMKDQMSEKLVINEMLARNDTLILSADGVNYDHSTPTIVDIINLLPEEINISGDLRVHGENVTINRDDQFEVQYEIVLPLIFSASQGSFSQLDSLKIEDNVRDFLRNNSNSAGIILTVENGFPISGTLTLSVGPDSTNISSQIVSIGLPKPTLTNGIVSNPGVATFNINLDKQKFAAIAEANFYQYEVTINNVSNAVITANNYIIIQDIFISGSFLVDPEGMSGNGGNR